LHPVIKVSADFINARLGLELAAEEMKQLLENVEFQVALDDELTVTAPFWRTDIELREDVVEEIGRLYGYDKLPLILPQRNLTPVTPDPLLVLKARIRQSLAKAGANEVLTYSFVHGDLLDKVGQDKSQAFQLANALSPDLQYYRPSLMPSLLEKVHPNVKAGYDEFALFELGKTHGSDNGADETDLPREFEFTALVVAAADKLKKPGSAYYQARRYLADLVGVPLELKPVGEGSQKFAVVQPYDPNRAAMVSVKDGAYLGIIGEFRPSVARALKLPRYTAGFEIDTTALQAIFHTVNYRPLSRFPKVTQDITLKVPAKLVYQELFSYLWEELQKAKPDNTLTDLAPTDIYQKDADHKNVTFRLRIASYSCTLTDAQVNELLDRTAAAVKTKFGAERL
jgi:phenylalanyl-tRNA synthetase beta chain